VRQEWESLRTGLPPTIWVRAYESRRAPTLTLILTPTGTMMFTLILARTLILALCLLCNHSE